MAGNLVARLKVLADLLTYRIDFPQEGRIRRPETDIEMRVSTFPTVYGEKAVVRLFGGASRASRLSASGASRYRRLGAIGRGRGNGHAVGT